MCLMLGISSNYAGQQDSNKKKFSSEVERGYTPEQIEKGWNYGDDPDFNKTVRTTGANNRKGQKDLLAMIEEMLEIQKEHLKEQKRIREILEEQFDPKPKMVTKSDGTQCIANSSSDCFVFPLVAEAKRVPVMAEYLQHPDDMSKVAEWKKWFSKFLNHNFNIGKANEYEAALNGSTTFQTDFHRSELDNKFGYFGTAKAEHNSKIVNLFGSKKMLKLRILIGKTPSSDIYAMDDIARFINKHPNLGVELIFLDNNAATIYSDGANVLSFIRKAFTSPMVTKTINPSLFTAGMQTSPIFMPVFTQNGQDISKAITVGKISQDTLANNIIEWLIYEKIVDPATLNDSKILNDVGTLGEQYMMDTHKVTIKRRDK